MTPTAYWTHNTAYHPWILRRVRGRGRILDVGCGDGLLLERAAPVCGQVTGIEPHSDAARRARERLACTENAAVIEGDFFGTALPAGSFDAVVFAASLHHMDEEAALLRAKELLAPGGILLVVGLTKPAGAADVLVEAARVIPAKIGSVLHGERRGGEIGVPTKSPAHTTAELRRICMRTLPGVKFRRGLYYRVLAEWEKRARL